LIRILSMLHIFRTTSLALFLALSGACAGGDSSDDHVARATTFINEGNLSAATIELKNALQKNPKDAEARLQLGAVYLALGEIDSAEKELRRATMLGAPNGDTASLLGRALLQQGKFQEVLALDESGLAKTALAILLATKAQASLELGDVEVAKMRVQRAESIAPELDQVQLASASILLRSGDPASALEKLEQALARNPEFGPAWSLRGQIELSRNDFENSRTSLEKASSLNSDFLQDSFRLGLVELQLGDYEGARKQAKRLLKYAPRYHGGNYIQGMIYFNEENYLEASASLTLAEPGASEFPPIYYYLASARLLNGNTITAENAARGFLQRVPGSAPGGKLLAAVLLMQNKSDDVPQLLAPALEENPEDIAALNLLATALQRQGRINESIETLASIARLQPDSAPAQLRLGASMLASGDDSGASRHIEAALELDPELQQAEILNVLSLLQKEDYDAAIAAAKVYRKRRPANGDSTADILLGRTYLKAGKKDEARETFEKALKLYPGDIAANSSLAAMELAAGNSAQARQRYEAILAQDKNSLPGLLALARLDATENRENDMVAHLQHAIAAHPGELEPRLLLGRYYLSINELEKIALLLSPLSDVQKMSAPVLRLQALAQLSAGDHDDASYTLEQLNKTAAPNADTHYLIAIAAAGKGDIAKARRELDKAIDIDDNHVKARIMLAKTALTEGDSAALTEHMEKLESIAPQSGDLYLLKAEQANGSGDRAATMSYLEKAFIVQPSTTTLLALTAYQAAFGQAQAAMENRQQWLGSHPDDLRVRLALAESYQQAGQVRKGMIEYEASLELAPDNIVALNNLAWNLREEKPAQALEYARRANTITPGSADILDTLAVVEYFNEDYPAARRSIRSALDAAPANPTLLYHQAMIEVALDNKAEAIEILERVLGSAANDERFTKQAQAEKLLAKLRP
jgi:putative PEP-CTERM system TPR-repeat lipoprotein